MIQNVIKNLGFTEKESKIYIACLELWNALVSSIARNSWENRITVYSILKDMKKRWIAMELTKNNIKYFSVIEPEILLKKEREKVEMLEKSMPELLAISNAFSNKPKLYFYEWINWLKEIYEDLLTSNTDIKAFLWYSNIENKNFLRYALDDFLPRRIKKNIFAKVILSDTEKNREYKKIDKKNNRESIIIDSDIFKIKNEINIYWGNKIAISLFSDKEIWGLIIKSKTLYETLESIFDLVWLAYNKK